MTYKLVSTFIIPGSGGCEECKCEIYHYHTDKISKFVAFIYLHRNVLIANKRNLLNLNVSGELDQKYAKIWVQAEVLKDIDNTTLEEVEATVKKYYLEKGFFISSCL